MQAGLAAGVPGEFEQAHHRLRSLYEISKLLTGFEGVERTLPEVISLVTQAIPARSAIFMVATHGQSRTMVWHAADESAQHLHAAKARARTSYAYLTQSSIELDGDDSGTRELPSAPPQPPEIGPEGRSGFVTLPLVVAQRPIFGTLQLETAGPLAERDLFFANAVVNQLAIALDRQSMIDARQAMIEVARAEAERRQMSAERLRERYEALVDNLDHAFVWQANARTFKSDYVSARVAGLLGYPRERWLADRKFWMKCVHPADRKALRYTFQRAVIERRDQRIEHRCVTADGRVIWLHTGVHAAQVDASGIQLQGVSIDITSAKQLEAALRDREAYFRELMQKLPQLVWTNQPDGQIDFVNDLWLEYTGQTLEFVRSSPQAWLFALHPEDRRRVRDIYAEGTRSGQGFTVETRVRRAADGAYRWHLNRSVALRDRDGAVLEFLGTCTDIHDLKHAQEQAQLATRAREDVLAVVSHDLKNPLSAIMMCVDILRGEAKRHDRRHSRRWIESIGRSAVRMSRLIQDLLDSASIDAGHLSIEPERLVVAPLVSEAVEAFRALSISKSLQLQSELPDDLPDVYGDAARLQQVLSNLIGNAIKFTPPGGTITVRAEPAAGAVHFSVTDTGPGIAPEEHSHLFERFWQAPGTARLGTGLGLFIVKGIVEASGGRVWVDSKAGAGSTFVFTLPLTPQQQDGAADLASKHPAATTGAMALSSELRAEVERHAAGLEELTQVELQRRELSRALEATEVARELAERAGQFRHDLVGLVSHELRGPLTALELLLERMQLTEDPPPSPKQRQLIERMFAALSRMTAVVESLLQHALIESGRLTTQIEPLDLAAMIAAVVEEMRPYADQKHLLIRYAQPKSPANLTSDPELVRLILLNLVGNAIKFTERGVVEISIDCVDTMCRVAVKDSGPGIPAADRARVFEPFAHIGGTKAKHVPGMGLGLALVDEVTRALGGHVELESEVEQGSTFAIFLPLDGQAAAQQHHETSLH